MAGKFCFLAAWLSLRDRFGYQNWMNFRRSDKVYLSMNPPDYFGLAGSFMGRKHHFFPSFSRISTQSRNFRGSNITPTWPCQPCPRHISSGCPYSSNCGIKLMMPQRHFGPGAFCPTGILPHEHFAPRAFCPKIKCPSKMQVPLYNFGLLATKVL